MINILKKYKFYILGGLIVFVGIAFYLINRWPDPKPDCDAQDKLIHEMQQRIQRDSSLVAMLQQSSVECARQAAGIVAVYEKELHSKQKTIELLKNSNFVLQDGLQELERQYRGIDSTRFNRFQLDQFFKNY